MVARSEPARYAFIHGIWYDLPSRCPKNRLADTYFGNPVFGKSVWIA
jgi:hypothetical protein